MIMPGRKFAANSKYRYGFNGKENDNEVSGNGNQYDYGFRIYNPRLGRFLTMDPLSNAYPWNSTYAYAEGDVIRSIDLDGLEKKIVTTLSWKNSDGIVLTQTTSVESKNEYNLGKGTLYINKVDNQYFDATGTHGDIITTTNYEPQPFLSKVADFFTGQIPGGDNKFGFVYTSKSEGGSTLGIGSDNVQFGETLDIDLLIKTMGAIRDVSSEKSTMTDFMKNKVLKGYYNLVKASMKVGDVLSSSKTSSPTSVNPTSTTPSTTSSNTKEGATAAVKATTKKIIPKIKATKITALKTIPDSIMVWKHDGDSANGTQNMRKVVNPKIKKKGGN